MLKYLSNLHHIFHTHFSPSPYVKDMCSIMSCFIMGVPSEISLPTKKPDIRPNLGEGVRWSQIRLDQPLDQEGRKEIRLDQPSCRRLRRDSMLL